MKSIAKSGKSISQNTRAAKSAASKQPTSTTKSEGENTSLPRILSWLCAAHVTTELKQTPAGRGKTDT